MYNDDTEYLHYCEFANKREPVTDLPDDFDYSTLAPRRANARLIAAAPELLAALQSIMVFYPDMCADAGMCADPHTMSLIHAGRAAIAKATAS